MRPTERPNTPYTNQEVFDHIWQHFIVEKNPRSISDISSDELNKCHYNGTGCAIGCCLTEEDGNNLETLFYSLRISAIYKHPEVLDIFKLYFGPAGDMLFLTKCQNWHDFDELYGKENLIKLGLEYNLRIPDATT